MRRHFGVCVAVFVLVGSLSLTSGSPAGGATPGFEPFPSWSGLVTRVYTDLMATGPSSSVRSTWVSDLDGGSKTKGDLVDSLRRGSENTTNVDPATRLYRAFMGRTPDAGGLKFWVARRRTGSWTLVRSANYFAGSSEFKTKYGSLTNRQFVTLIYTDVMERPADPSGVNFWTSQLDTGKRSRGAVMVGFSESSEYRNRQRENVDVAVAYIFLLNRAPNTAEVTDWVTRQKAGTTHSVLAKELLDSAKYSKYITGVAPTVPGAPTNVAAVAGNASATVSWTAPATSGGMTITGYVVTPYVGATAQTPVQSSGVGTSKVVTGLTNGTTYTFMVAATNAVGSGTDSLASNSVTVGGSIGVQASAGGYHSCAVFSAGNVKCWGYNEDRQLGDGTATDSSVPVGVSGITTATEVSAGGLYSCALLSDGRVKCWGNNDYGQLGDGTNARSGVPVSVSGISTATAVSAGRSHSCAVLSGGSVKCWGYNNAGQLGDGTTTNSSVPVSVTGISTATAVSAGVEHSCAVLSGGSVKCWGSNVEGQLGNGTTIEASSVPVSVFGISTATAVSAGSSHNCVLLSGGGVKCWGSNDYGQLGDGTNARSGVPVSVFGISTATAVSAGSSHNCVLLSGGGVKCWGSNGNGRLGDGTSTNSSVPVSVSGIFTATAVSAGRSHSCAVLDDGSMKCWGENTGGRLGDGTTTESHVPVSVIGFS